MNFLDPFLNHKNHERIKRKEEEKLSKMTDEEKDEYFMIKNKEDRKKDLGNG